MEPVSNLVKVHVPNYLANLPIPNSIGGWFKLSVRDWASLIPFFAVIGGSGYITYRAIKPRRPVNPNLQKDEKKVVHSFQIGDLEDKTSFCRCWRSTKFPYCDGTHGPYNRECGDNVGPLVITK